MLLTSIASCFESPSLCWLFLNRGFARIVNYQTLIKSRNTRMSEYVRSRSNTSWNKANGINIMDSFPWLPAKPPPEPPKPKLLQWNNSAKSQNTVSTVFSSILCAAYLHSAVLQSLQLNHLSNARLYYESSNAQTACYWGSRINTVLLHYNELYESLDFCA